LQEVAAGLVGHGDFLKAHRGAMELAEFLHAIFCGGSGKLHPIQG
jgi:hypothetical protein